MNTHLNFMKLKILAGNLVGHLAWAGVRPTLQATYEGRDGLLWWRDLAHYQDGDLSLAVTQANNLLEDHCCVESGLPIGTVIGVFDGHGGPEAAQFACGNLLPNLRGETQDATIFTLAT
jgi:pyruvate dehydrogenase phosphatase